MQNNQPLDFGLTETQRISGEDAINSYVTSFCEQFCKESSKVDLQRGNTELLGGAIVILSKIIEGKNQESTMDIIEQNYSKASPNLRQSLKDLLLLSSGKFSNDHILQLQIARLSKPEIVGFSEETYKKQIRSFISEKTCLSINNYLRANHHHFIEQYNQIQKMQIEMEKMELKIKKLQEKNSELEKAKMLKPLAVVRPREFATLARSNSCPELYQ